MHARELLLPLTPYHCTTVGQRTGDMGGVTGEFGESRLARSQERQGSYYECNFSS